MKKTTDQENETAEIMRRFNDVFLRRDPSALPELIADDCVIENIRPVPSPRLVGGVACVERWREVATMPGTRFELEETIVAKDRAIVLWKLHQADGAMQRGVNIMRVRDGRIVEGLGYAKSR